MNQRRPHFNSPARAFTLIEIMVVVAILGIILMTGIPSVIHSLQKEGMSKAVSDIYEACKVARESAIMKQQKAQMVFHPLEGGFSAPGFSSQLPPNVSILILGVNFIQLERDDLATVNFYPDGTSDEFTIVIQDQTGSQCKITLDIITGRPVGSDNRNK